MRLIHVLVLPFAVTLELVDIAEGRHHDDDNSGEASEAKEGHNDVGSGNLHERFVTVFIIAPFSGKAKGG